MIIRSASFIKSSTRLSECPISSKPEFGFIGRSNVGKSSLINMLTGWSRLAKISGEPGKTRTINHFLINNTWHLVDLPGYGYARVPAAMREKWMRNIKEFIMKRENLICLFVLLDSRHMPQKSDLEFMEFLGTNSVPFARVFTKKDKVSSTDLTNAIQQYDNVMLERWESLPVTFTASSLDKSGREEILSFIEETINKFSKDA